MYKIMQQYREDLAKQVLADQERFVEFPEANLYCKRDGKYVKWFEVTDNGKRTYIPKSEKERAELLAEKLLVKTRLDANSRELMGVDKYLELSQNAVEKIDMLLRPDSVYRELLIHNYKSVQSLEEEWKNSEFKTNTGYRDGLTYNSPSGNILRSKSEMMIDMYLFNAGVAYRYESKLELTDGSCIFPDFTILVDGVKKKYWEHCGMMATDEYVDSFCRKIKLYAANEIYLNEDLFVTFETQDAPLQMSDIDNTFKKIMR